MRYFLEACCTSAADAVTAQRAGARRIELCSRLDIGGVTPSEDLIRSTLLALAEDTLIATFPSASLAADVLATSPSVPSSSPSSPLAGDAPSHSTSSSSSAVDASTPSSSAVSVDHPSASSLSSPSSPSSLSSPLAADAPSAASPSVSFAADVPATSPSVPSSSPSSPLAAEAPSAAPIQVNVLIRPRGGDFVYSEEEIQQTIAGIEMCKQLSVRDSAGKEHRVNGVVIGALRADGGIDMAAMRRLVAAARPLQVTFHRAFDECADVERGLEDVIALGCERLLTSGHEPDACAGRFTLARLVRQAAGRIVILAGRGVRPHNIAAIASAITELNPSSAIAGLSTSSDIAGLSTSSSIAGVTLSSALAGDNPSATVKERNTSAALEFHSSTLTGW